MRFRTITSLSIFFAGWFGALLAASAQVVKGTNGDSAKPQAEARTRARAKIIVQSSEAKPYDSTTPALIELRLNETFHGELDGQSAVRALQVRSENGPVRMVSEQRFSGKLCPRQGTFVLQGAETVENGKIEATWFVVPGSGTGDLARLRGEGGFTGDFGKGSEGTLHYWFE